MNKYILPTSVEINDKKCEFKTDFRDVLYLFEIISDPDLLDGEKTKLALENFYITDDYLEDINEAAEQMVQFIDGGEERQGTSSSQPLFDWEQDFSIIAAPVNRILGSDVRGMEYLHWWTFLSAFMEIGECTFNTFVGIRDKQNKGTRLEKHEERIFMENRDKILLKKKYDTTTQQLLNEILGREV